jgi:glycosyltransferase involved in cell wall biosynthesis
MISEMLADRGIQADVLATSVKDDYPAHDLRYRVIRCAVDAKIGNKGISAGYVRAIRRLQPEYDAAIVHLPNPMAVLAMLAFWRKPFVILWHADIPQRVVRALSRPFDQLLASRAAAVIGPTEIHLTGSRIARHLKPRGVVIGFPFDAGRLPVPTGVSEAWLETRAFINGRRLVIAIGRLVGYKGYEYLIDAAARTPDDLAFVIVGSGPLESALQARIDRLSLGSRMRLMGHVDEDGLVDLLANAAIGCMPSVTSAEMYGMVQVEMMAFGLPVISTDIPRSGVPQVNRHNETGLVVPPRDAHALAHAIRLLGEDEALRSRLSQGARDRVARQHRQDAIALQYEELLRSVTGQESRSDPEDNLWTRGVDMSSEFVEAAC